MTFSVNGSSVLRPGQVVEAAVNFFVDGQVLDTTLLAEARWAILDNTGEVYATGAGGAMDLQGYNPTLNSTQVRTVFNITVPENLVATQMGEQYVVVYQLSLVGGYKTTASDTFTVQGDQDELLGPAPAVFIQNGSATTELTFVRGDLSATPIKVSVFYGNDARGVYENIVPSSVVTLKGNGKSYEFPVEVTNLAASLMPYAVLWETNGLQEVSPFWVINASISMAIRELHQFVSKNQSEWTMPEWVFTNEQLVAALYNGACMFNADQLATNFSMTNAQGPIRAFWIQYSAVWLLQSQAMTGVQTDFNFSASAVSLDVDRASKFQQLGDALESQLSQKVRPLKIALTKRGNINGDGSASPTALAAGAVGSIGLSISPVSKVGILMSPYNWRAGLLGGGLPNSLGGL